MMKITKHIQEVTSYIGQSKCYLMCKHYSSLISFPHFIRWAAYRKYNLRFETDSHLINLFKELAGKHDSTTH